MDPINPDRGRGVDAAAIRTKEMNMDRRSFVGRTILSLVALNLPLCVTGCNVFTDILNWVPIGINAISGVLSLLGGAGIVLGPGVVALLGLIQAGLTDLRLAIVEYQSTTPPPAGALAKIDTFLGDLVNNLGNVLTQLPVGPASIIGLAAGLLELVLGMIQGFISKVPMASFPKTVAALKRPLVNGAVPIVIPVRMNLSRRKFIHDYNLMAEAGGHPQVKLPESFWQHF